jgi:hypothetical protein
MFFLTHIDNDVPSLAEQVFAPYIILFLDCVYQLQHMNQTAFEFTEGYLAQLAYQCFTSKTFEFTHLNPTAYLNQPQGPKGSSSTSQDSVELASVFSFVPTEPLYVNRFYVPPPPPPDALHRLDYQPSEMRIWKSYFGRYSPELSPTLESTQGEYSHTQAYW